jgi:anti-sigma factor ChrR (cupin superfamily)
MQKIFNTLFLSCLKASELIEKKMHFKLSWREKIQLSVHKSMCDACRIYEKQSSFIEKGIASYKPESKDNLEVKDLKEKIHRMLESR